MAIECQLGDSVYSALSVTFDPLTERLYSGGTDLAWRHAQGWRMKDGDPMPAPRFEPSAEQIEIVLVAEVAAVEQEVARSATGFDLIYNEQLAIYQLTDLRGGFEVARGYGGNWWIPGNNSNTARLHIEQGFSTVRVWLGDSFEPKPRVRLSALAQRVAKL